MNIQIVADVVADVLGEAMFADYQCGRELFAYFATIEVGASPRDVGEVLKCSAEEATWSYLSCSKLLADREEKYVALAEQIKAALTTRMEVCPHVLHAIPEEHHGKMFTTIPLDAANDSQRLVIVVLALQLGGKILGRGMVEAVLPVPPTHPAVSAALDAANHLQDYGSDGAAAAIAQLWPDCRVFG